MRFVKRNMNLFEVPNTYSYAHCISGNGKMGAGIAKLFRKNHPIQTEKIDEYIKENGHFPIGSSVFMDKEENENATFYLVTKDMHFHKPTRENLNRSLYNMKKQVEGRGVKKLALPMIASGLDKLDWEETEKDIKTIFTGVDVDILVCVYQG